MAKNLTIAEAAKAVGFTPNTIRKWIKSDKALAKATRKKDRKHLLPPAAMARLKKLAAATKRTASPALLKAWAARKAQAGKTARKSAKKSAPGKVRKAAPRKAGPPTAAPRRTKVHRVALRRRKTRARKVRKTAAIRLPGSVQDALNQIAASVGKAVDQSTVELKSRLRSILLAQRNLIDKALKELG